MSFVLWILEHKLLTSLILVSGTLFISTIVLGVQKSELTDRVNDCAERLTTAAPTTTMPPTTESPNFEKYRLPKNIEPISYDLTLKPNLESKLFSGTVKVKVNVLEDVKEVIMNSHTLSIDSVKVEAVDVQHDLDIPYERLVVTRPGGFKKGEHELTIQYNGNMTGKLVGLYHSTFKHDGKDNENLQEQVQKTIRNHQENVKKRLAITKTIRLVDQFETSASNKHNPFNNDGLKQSHVNLGESIFIRPSLHSIRSKFTMSDASLRSNQSNTVVITPYTDDNQRGRFCGDKKCFLFSSAMLNTKSRLGKTVPFLVSCVVFLAVLCACLVATLVFVGRHVMAAAMADQNAGGFLLDGQIVAEEKTLFRLPADIKPIHYDITMMPDLNNASFQGKVTITIELSEERKDILLHSYKLLIDKIVVEKTMLNDVTSIPPLETSSNELNFTPAYLRATGMNLFENSTVFSSEKDEENLRNITVIGFELTEESQILRINLRKKLMRGFYDITIEFQGDMKDKLNGFYYSEYFATINGTVETEKRPIATTKFEPTYARQAYPCFDEPNLKATYTIHLLKPNDDFVALSNMPEKGDHQRTDEGILVSFEISERMSTYLVCFIVSTMDFTETKFGNGANERPLRVFATPGQEEKTKYALDTGKKIMDFYLTYFNIPYPLPKLDMVAIPDFVSGAMENWGLVTFRETALLYDKGTSSDANKARVAEVVAHELAHSWFGNLVTMNWWDDLWLNEGFASYIEYKGVHAAENTWQMMDQFLTADLHDVLILDATTASHPIVQKADTPDQITAMFDTISYKKGAAILRMLEDSITPAIFQKGVTNYLEKYKYKNAVTNDFWNEMNEVSAKEVDVAAIMKTWTTQMGYPVVTVTKSVTKYTLKQERYLTNSETTYNDPDYKWIIPITYITDKDNSKAEKIRQLIWFSKDEPQIEIDIPGANWVKFNFHQTGYYRINYAKSEWRQFSDLLNSDHSKFDVSDRANLLEESFRLAESGHVSYNIPLDLSKYLVDERDFVVWSVAVKVLGQLKNYLFNFASNENYQKYVANLIKPVVGWLKWEESDNDTDLQKRLRPLALSLACQMGDLDCLNKAQSEFKKWLEKDIQLHQNIRGIIYSYGIQRATKEEWRQVLAKYEESTDANEKVRLLDALSHVKDPELLLSFILYAQDRANIRDQDYFTCMALISNNPIGTALVWNYVRSNWLQIVDRFTLNERNLGRMIPQITKSFSMDIAFEEMEAFFGKHPEAGAGAAARLEALETVKNNIIWVSKYEKTVSKWIIDNPPAIIPPAK